MKIAGILGTALALALAAPPGAFAGVATYNSTAPIHVGDDNAPDGVISPITVPAGRTGVQSVEITNLRIDWGTSAQELIPSIAGIDGTEVTLFDVGCAGFEPQDVWNFSDAAAQLTPNDKFDPKCDLPGGTFRPVEKLSVFSGKAASGTWKLRAIDDGELFSNQGDIDSWALRITHVPPKLTATPPNKADLDGKLKVFAKTDADGTVSAGAAKVKLGAGQQAAVPFKVGKKLRKRIEDKGKSRVKVKVAFTDETGGTANAVVPVKVTS
jgi:hypothetical protein